VENDIGGLEQRLRFCHYGKSFWLPIVREFPQMGGEPGPELSGVIFMIFAFLRRHR